VQLLQEKLLMILSLFLTWARFDILRHFKQVVLKRNKNKRNYDPRTTSTTYKFLKTK
jgi:hypothetical protein